MKRRQAKKMLKNLGKYNSLQQKRAVSRLKAIPTGIFKKTESVGLTESVDLLMPAGFDVHKDWIPREIQLKMNFKTFSIVQKLDMETIEN